MLLDELFLDIYICGLEEFRVDYVLVQNYYRLSMILELSDFRLIKP